jgi:hypothetical protein
MKQPFVSKGSNWLVWRKEINVDEEAWLGMSYPQVLDFLNFGANILWEKNVREQIGTVIALT